MCVCVCVFFWGLLAEGTFGLKFLLICGLRDVLHSCFFVGVSGLWGFMALGW